MRFRIHFELEDFAQVGGWLALLAEPERGCTAVGYEIIRDIDSWKGNGKAHREMKDVTPPKPKPAKPAAKPKTRLPAIYVSAYDRLDAFIKKVHRPVTTGECCDLLEKYGLQRSSAYGTLNKLVKDDKIERLGSGGSYRSLAKRDEIKAANGDDQVNREQVVCDFITKAARPVELQEVKEHLEKNDMSFSSLLMSNLLEHKKIKRFDRGVYGAPDLEAPANETTA